MSSEKVPLSFVILGKTFSYEGNPAHRERQFFDLVNQRGLPETDLASSYRQNFPDYGGEDDVIMQRYHARVVEKAQKKARNANRSTEILPNVVDGESNSNTTNNSPPSPTKQLSSQHLTVPVATTTTAKVLVVDTLQPPPPSSNTGSRPASLGMSPEEVEEINKYIQNVLAEGKKTGTSTSSPQTTQQQQQPVTPTTVTKPSTTSNSTTQQQQPSSGGEKYHIFLHVEGAESQKLLTMSQGSAYVDLQDAVSKKLGGQTSMGFVDDECMRIDVDDDDSFEMFLSQQILGKKLVLKCAAVTPRGSGSPPPTNVTTGRATPLVAPATAIFDSTLNNNLNATGGTTQSNESSTKGVIGDVVKKAEATGGAPAPAENLLVRTYVGHSAAVYGCAFSPDGTEFASASRDHTIRIWSTERGTVLQNIKAHKDGFVLCCAFNPKGTHVVSCSDDCSIKLWNRKGKKMYMLKEHTDKVYCTQFLGDGSTMASCSCDATVKVWNVEKGTRIASLKPHDKAIFRLGASNTDGGKYLSTSCDDHTSYIVDWREAKTVRKLIGHTSTVWCSQFSSDDKYMVTASMDQTFRMWEVASGREVACFNGHTTPVHAAAFCAKAHDTALISCARDWTLGVWDATSTKLVTTLSGHTNTVYNFTQFEDYILSSSLDETLKLWKVPKAVVETVV